MALASVGRTPHSRGTMRLPSLCFLALLASPLASLADDPVPRPVMGEIVRVDAALDALLDPGAKLEVLASGLDWSDG